jgi:hypothetical protein
MDVIHTPDLLPPPVPDGATSQQCIAAWADLVDAAEQFLLAGLRREIGPDGDLRAACRQWSARQAEEHYQTLLRVAEHINRHGGGHAG